MPKNPEKGVVVHPKYSFVMDEIKWKKGVWEATITLLAKIKVTHRAYSITLVHNPEMYERRIAHLEDELKEHRDVEV